MGCLEEKTLKTKPQIQFNNPENFSPIAVDMRDSDSYIDVLLRNLPVANVVVYIRPVHFNFERIKIIEESAVNKTYYFPGIDPEELNIKAKLTLEKFIVYSDSPIHNEDVFRHILNEKNYEKIKLLIERLSKDYLK